jgi:hypothetical protein
MLSIDFAKWWATTGQSSNYNWGNMDLPYLDCKDADAFEPVDEFARRFAPVSHLAAITLLKIRLLLDLRALQRAREEHGPQIPQEVLQSIEQHLVSSVVTGNKQILERQDHAPQIAELERQIRQCYDTLSKENEYFWPALVKPGADWKTRPSVYMRGTEEEMQLFLSYSYPAWAQTPGAIDVIEELSKQTS